MAHDREVLRMIWEGQIGICFQADSDEIVGIKPEPFYLMVSRLSYLPLVTDKVRKYFTRYIAAEHQDGAVWFDFNGTPLRLHYPIGVLYDLLHPDEDSTPWCITIHFSKFPEESLVKLNTKELLESHFLSCLKEADVLKHRGLVISAMQKKDHNQLWLGLINEKFDQFWAVNRRLMEPYSDQESFKNIPVRFYNDDDFTYMQKLISPLSESGQKKNLSDLMAELSTPVRKAVGFRTHGIDLHEETQLQWMSEHLSYPDNFLHLSVDYKSI
ncbi:hypothetical protein KR215_000337 [Drosophila sulfurigaster]|uniref:autophagy protein 5 n=1 Tax=Drosophila sulfurigaster albostrigata TaxID=89887 RepID=UPI002D21DF7D|nr:autophagy protein 5 [Drosophila sulfurigaster albostrigata]KAH8411214.1 hypothetical protein KR215_000337 [Drosophila sulfurigaster]